ncbi:MAG: hypothetical protein ACI4QT_11020 [Kiritimatiellia bacterium]
MKTFLRILFSATLCLALCSGCSSTKQNVLGSDADSFTSHKMQGMYLDTDDTDLVLRAAISTLQDFGFILTQSDRSFGIISGIAFPSDAAITLIVRPHGNQTYVRANIRHDYRQIQDKEVYKRFFTELAQSMSLTAKIEMDESPQDEAPTPAPAP